MSDLWRDMLAYQNDKAAIGIVSGGTPRMECMVSLWKSQYVDAYRGLQRFQDPALLAIRGGVNLSRPRNELVRMFLELDRHPEWLFMIDDDMTWDDDAFEHLLASARPDRIVGGLCFAYGKEGRIGPTIFGRDQYGRATAVPDDWTIPDDSLIQVTATGAAFLCVHREAFEAIAKVEPDWARDVWFREEWLKVDNPDHDPADPESLATVQHYLSEDIFFCMQAHRAGLSVWVNTAVEAKHCKPHLLTRKLFESDTSAMEWA